MCIVSTCSHQIRPLRLTVGYDGHEPTYGVTVMRHRDLSDSRQQRELLALQERYAVLMIPVAADYHLAAIHLYRAGHDTLDVHATEAVKCMRYRVIPLCRICLTDV